MVVPEVEDKLKTLCGGDVKHVVLFGIEVLFVLFDLILYVPSTIFS